MQYIFVKFCNEVRQGYAVVHVNDVELDRARTAIKAIEAKLVVEGIGAALSTTLAGYTIDHFGSSVAFWSLASVAVCGLGLVWLLLPETRPDPTLSRTPS